MAKDLDNPGLKIIKPVNDRLAAAADYQYYRLMKKMSQYDNDGAQELHMIPEKIVAQIKDHVSSEKDHISVIVFLHE